MAIVKPFKAWRPDPEFAIDIASVPYDVIDTKEARELAKGKPNSFLHVIRPEIDVSPNTSIYDPKVYQKGKENLSELLNSKFFTQEESESLYIYHLEMGERSQTGIFGCISVEDYNNEVILKHELTRPKKEDDRTKHIVTQQAHAEPVMMTFKDTEEITAFMNGYMSSTEPIYDITFEDDVRHVIWKVDNHEGLTSSFDKIPKLYIADGHHRCASAARAAKEFASQNPHHTGNEAYNFFPAVLFPVEQMEILAYNRIIYSVPDNFLSALKKEFKITKNVKPMPQEKGSIALYFEEQWIGLTLKDAANHDPASKLDISLLQDQIFEPFLGIKDQRTDPNIDFVGGIRGTNELEKIVDNGEASLAISMYPTSIEELLDVSDAGQLMPPKSTWFEPKLRSGFLVHSFSE